MPSDPTHPRPPTLAVIGGSGFYTFLDDVREVPVRTPYGEPSGPVAVGGVGGREVAFLPRHGAGHALPPHLINYRANLWALRSLGVRQVFAPCAVGSLLPELQPGALVVPDQLLDRTAGRAATFVERGAVHASFADPYCDRLRGALLSAAPDAVDGGTMVVIEGPRFSTRAESRSYAAQGCSLINMTGQPEASLARELGLCYAPVAVVTDIDAGVTREESVDQAQVFAVFAANMERLKGILQKAVAAAPDPGPCPCNTWLEGLEPTYDLP